jgi:hypothetical protein
MQIRNPGFEYALVSIRIQIRIKGGPNLPDPVMLDTQKVEFADISAFHCLNYSLSI